MDKKIQSRTLAIAKVNNIVSLKFATSPKLIIDSRKIKIRNIILKV